MHCEFFFELRQNYSLAISKRNFNSRYITAKINTITLNYNLYIKLKNSTTKNTLSYKKILNNLTVKSALAVIFKAACYGLNLSINGEK